MFPLREIFKTQLLWPAVAIVATAAHHLVLKHTPAGANPFPRVSLPAINWTAFMLGAVTYFSILPFRCSIRSGFDATFGELVTQPAAADP